MLRNSMQFYSVALITFQTGSKLRRYRGGKIALKSQVVLIHGGIEVAIQRATRTTSTCATKIACVILPLKRSTATLKQEEKKERKKKREEKTAFSFCPATALPKRPFGNIHILLMTFPIVSRFKSIPRCWPSI